MDSKQIETIIPEIVTDDYNSSIIPIQVQQQEPKITETPLNIETPPIITIEFPEEQLGYVRDMLDAKKEIPIVQNQKRPDNKRFEIGQIYPTTWGDQIIITRVIYCILPTQLPTWGTMSPDERQVILDSIGQNGIDNLCWMTFKKYRQMS